MIIAETIEELSQKLDSLKVNLEKKGLRVNTKKTKIMFSGVNMDTLIDTGAYPCGVCRSGVGKNSIFAQVVNIGCIRSVVVFVAG